MQPTKKRKLDRKWFLFFRENEAVAEEDRKAEEAKKPFSGKGHVLAAPTDPR